MSDDQNTEVLDTENAEVETELTEEQAAEKAAEAEAFAAARQADFEAATLEAVENADTTTGTVPEAFLEPVRLAFKNLATGAKHKNVAKNFVGDSMKDVLASGDMANVYKAVAWNSINEAIAKAAPSAGVSVRETVSPDKLYADKVQSLRLAVDLVENEAPEGVTEDWASSISEADSLDNALAYLEWAKADDDERGEEPEASDVVKAAVKLALSKGPRKGGKGVGGRTHLGPKRDVGKHIISAFESVPSGTFLSVTNIKDHRSEEYGADAFPSPGAINQRLRPPNGKPTTIPGIRVEKGEGDVWGATKL